MRKLLIGFALLLLFIAVFSVGVAWNAMVQMGYSTVHDNIFRAKREVAFFHYQLQFETGEVEEGLHWWKPETVIKQPKFVLTTTDGVYRISIPELIVRNDVMTYHQAELIPVGPIRIENTLTDEEVYVIEIDDVPTIEVRGDEPSEESAEDGFLFYNEFRYVEPTIIRMKVRREGSDKAHSLTLSAEGMPKEWDLIYFQFYHHLVNFVHKVQKASKGDVLP